MSEKLYYLLILHGGTGLCLTAIIPCFSYGADGEEEMHKQIAEMKAKATTQTEITCYVIGEPAIGIQPKDEQADMKVCLDAFNQWHDQLPPNAAPNLFGAWRAGWRNTRHSAGLDR